MYIFPDHGAEPDKLLDLINTLIDLSIERYECHRKKKFNNITTNIKNIDDFFHFLTHHATELIPEIVSMEASGEVSIGHVLSQYQTPKAVMQFLQLIIEYAREQLPHVLTKTSKEMQTIGHLIA